MAASTSASNSVSRHRLPSSKVEPKHYSLNYRKIDFDNFTFDGSVVITCTATKSSEDTRVKLHAIELQIHKATLSCCSSNTTAAASTDSSSTPLQAVEFRCNIPNQTCEIVFEEKNVFNEGSDYVLTIEFMGILNDQMHGLYRSTYEGLDGQQHIMATTQFEATDARRAFPCFDVPALKASFDLTVTIPSHLAAVSNTPMESTYTNYNGTESSKTITFQKTPKMSTYLLALIVGQFDGISRTSNHIVTTVYTVPGKARQGQFCLDTAVRCLDFYQELYGVPYPLPKSDLLAIPDFAAGAMENWGSVTYRESKILTKQGETSESARRGIARTVCHEIAHFWFGNMVTMEWWTQLWLKEGFARFMEFVACDALFPEWDIWSEFNQSVRGLALSLDAMKTSHPVEVEVSHPDEIFDIFDAISYAKGASIIRMMASYLGQETFFKGVRIYLNRHMYANAVTNDVWRALEEASGLPVVDFMAPWVLHMGFPILALRDDGSLEVSRFMASGPDPAEATPSWSIPVTAQVDGLDGVQGPWVLNGPSGDETEALKEKIVEWSSAGKWFKLNVNQSAFFRVSYTKEQWNRLSKAMDPDGPLSATDRLGLISDSFAAGKSGYSSIVDSLDLIAGFGCYTNSEYAVWQELSENLSGLASLVRSESFYPNFMRFLIQIYSGVMEKLGWEASADESPRTGTLRSTVIGMLGIAGEADVLKECFDIFIVFSKENSDKSTIAGDLRETIFRNALRHDEATVFQALKQIYENSSFPEEQQQCLSVMGCVKNNDRHAEMLEYALFSGCVRLQDVCFPLASLSGATDVGGRASWQYFKDNYARLHDKLGSGPMWANVVGLSVRGLSTPQDVLDVEIFFNEPSHGIGSAQQRLSKALEIVNVQMNRRDRDRSTLEKFLQDY